MKKLLLTGFEPFLNFKINPTEEIVKALDGKRIGDFEIIGRILVVDFQGSANEFRQALEEVQPDIIVSLGLAGGRYKITPERIAINLKDGEPDNNGYAPVDEAIYEGDTAGYFTNLPIRKMIQKLKENGYPAEISNTAGTYLCNNIMYEGMRYVKQYPDVLSGFIHIPANFELASMHGKIPGWHSRDLLAAITICIGEAIEAASR